MDASLDMDNHEVLKIPVERKEVTGILQRKKKKRVTVGRQEAANVIRTEGGVMGAPRKPPQSCSASTSSTGKF